MLTLTADTLWIYHVVATEVLENTYLIHLLEKQCIVCMYNKDFWCLRNIVPWSWGSHVEFWICVYYFWAFYSCFIWSFFCFGFIITVPPSVSLSVSSLHAHSLSVITFKVMPFVLFIFYFLLFFESHFQINSHLIR